MFAETYAIRENLNHGCKDEARASPDQIDTFRKAIRVEFSLQNPLVFDRSINGRLSNN